MKNKFGLAEGKGSIPTGIQTGTAAVFERRGHSPVQERMVGGGFDFL